NPMRSSTETNANGTEFALVSRTVPLIVRGNAPPLKPGIRKFTQSVKNPSVTGIGIPISGDGAPTETKVHPARFGTPFDYATAVPLSTNGVAGVPSARTVYSPVGRPENLYSPVAVVVV